MQQFARPLDLTAALPVEKRVPELIRVPATENLKGVIVSDQIWELETHWHNRRTRPCTAKQGFCELCETAPYRWYGLIALYRPLKQRAVWVQLTVDAIDTLRLAMRERTDLLGREVEIGRERPTMRAPIWVRFNETSIAPKRLPKPLTPHETLHRVFFGESQSRKRKAQ